MKVKELLVIIKSFTLKRLFKAKNIIFQVQKSMQTN